MPRLIVSPCGIQSLLFGVDESTRRLINSSSNAYAEADIEDDSRSLLRRRIAEVEQTIEELPPREAAKRSAELNGIVQLYGGQINGRGDEHILLATDTWLGREAARLSKTWLERQGCAAWVWPVPGLRTDDFASFQGGLTELLRWCSETVEDYRRASYQVIFNLTGGFKSVGGFLQTLAMFYADETVYLFEGSTALLRIPRLPIKLTTKDEIRDHLRAFRRLALSLPAEDVRGIAATFLLTVDGESCLNQWGELVWEQAKGELYAEALHDSPSKRLRFGPGFARSVSEYGPRRVAQVNQRIDDLTRYLERAERPNLGRLDFKPLQGKAMLPSTHELDAWADQDARRLFGHFEEDGKVFVLDKLDKALH